jgi:hypothetical protein
MNTSNTATRTAPAFFQNAVHAYRTACGATIELTERSRQHLAAHPDAFDILPEAIGKLRLPRQSHSEMEVDMGRIVGITTCISTPTIAPDDKTFFALRNGRQLPSRVITGSLGTPTSKVVVIAKKEQSGRNFLVTAWIGVLAKKEPWDRFIKGPHQFQECLDFWCSRALVHEPETMGPVFESTWKQILDTSGIDMSSIRYTTQNNFHLFNKAA